MDAETGDGRSWLHEQRRRGELRRQHWWLRETAWSWVRLACFAAAVVPWFVVPPAAAVVLMLLGLALFAGAVWQHQLALAARQAADRLLLVVDEALQRAGGHVVCVRSGARPVDAPEEDAALPVLLDRGPTWALTGQERDDLDLYAAPVGLFGLLNRTSIPGGARRLRDWLEHPQLAAERLLAGQNRVRWLAEHGEARLEIMAALAALRGEERRLAKLIQAIQGARPLGWRLPAAAWRAWSLASLLFTLFVLARTLTGDFRFGWPWLLLLAVNAAIFARVRGRVAAALRSWQDVGWAAGAALIAARQAGTHLSGPGDLQRLRAACAAAAQPEALPRLRWRVGWAERGGFVQGLLNIVLLADWHIADAILRAALPQRTELRDGLAALLELDALCSLAAFAAEQPQTCYPEPVEAPTLEITDGRHPLIAPERAVPNDVQLNCQVRLWVITGSNMAGKSTFLRMAGTNVLLAQLGTAATARAMRWSPARLISDLRARDDLAGAESYFLAEVRHLRRMVLPPPGETPILGLIDEPFRGTNSQDQSAASAAVMHHLLASPHLFLLATHDRRLTRLADDGAAQNRHFRENLEQGALVFDYRLHLGPAQTRNALRIIAAEGYPPELVARASALLEGQDAPEAGR